MGNTKYDFSGWATKNDLRCSDGRTIRKDAFKDNDGKRVSLIWNHDHNDPMNVLGHADLENRDEGVYAYCTLNDSAAGQHAKQLVMHGDVVSLSIWANKLKQVAGDVIHGDIKEVSLVLAGANPGATIDCVLAHSGEIDDEQAIIYYDKGITLAHADEEEKKPVEDEFKEKTEENLMKEASKAAPTEKEETVKDVWDTFTEEEKTVAYALIGQAIEDAKAKKGGKKPVKHSDEEYEEYLSQADGEDGPTVADVFNAMSEKKKNVVYLLVGQAVQDLEDGGDDEEDETDEEESDEGGNTTMKHNVFEVSEDTQTNVLSHAEELNIINNGRRLGSLREAVKQFSEDTGNELVIQHDDTTTYGIENIDYLFPEYKNVTDAPVFIKRDTTWVDEFLGGVKRTPFSRLKSILADITADEARAKGYVTGGQKADEVITLLNRTTDPTTVYKKQKIDRDNLVDITDFDVVAFLKGEMRIMLNEELAVAALIGDGREAGADKINETSIRPIWTDSDVFTKKYRIEVTADATEDDLAKVMIRGAVKARKGFRGTGTPTLYTTEENLTNMLLLEDLNGHLIYDDETKLARAMRVKKIVTVESMEGRERTVTLAGGGTETRTLMGVIVNPADYTMGATKGGEINMFDDFDIDFNQMKYLIETRCSGALTVPKSAIALECVVAS